MFIESITTSYFYNCTISSNSADPNGPAEAGGLYLSIDTTANLINCILHENTKTAIVEGDVTSFATLTNCLFYSNDDGDYYDFLDPGPSETITNDAQALNALAGNAGNVVSDPKFVAGSTGSATAEYDIPGNYTTISDGSAAYSTDELAGLLINPVDSQHFQGLILSNTATNIIIQGDLKSLYTDVVLDLVRAASTEPETYNIIDYHIQSTSGARNVGTNGGIASTDFDGEARPADGTTDIGVDEYVDTNSDGEPDYIDDDDDGDGLSDVDEAGYGTDPLDTDTDDDTLSDYDEIFEHGTDPTLADTDDDGFDDYVELAAGTDPNNDNDFPASMARAYVDASVGVSGDGTNWEEAFLTIQEGINAGTDVWVRAGTYTESIAMLSNRSVYGHFEGDETNFSQRPTSGFLTTINPNSDNDVVNIDSVSNTFLDGFTIINSTTGKRGVYIDNADATNTISNCIISGHSAEYGAGIFMQNSSILLTGLTLSNNTSLSGALFITASSPTVTDCTFTDNSSTFFGGAIYVIDGSSPTITNCTMTGNHSTGIAGAYFSETSSGTITNCTITDNSSMDQGGGVFLGSDNSVFTNCIINRNFIVGSLSGGGIYINGGSPSITDCTINGNTSTEHGGGIAIENSTATITGCNISGNSSVEDGGGLYISGGSPTLVGCTVSGNHSLNHGGGMFIRDSSTPTITNCIVSGNDSDNQGGGIHIRFNASATITNCTISSNITNTGGGAIHLLNNGDVILVNNIISKHSGTAVYEEDETSDATLRNNMFNDNGSDSDVWDFDTDTIWDADNIPSPDDDNIVHSGNFAGLTYFVVGTEGHWDPVVTYDLATNTTMFNRASAGVSTDELVGQILQVNESLRFEAVVIANTDTTVTVAGDLTIYEDVGVQEYSFKNYDILSDSDAIDAGTAAGAPDDDINGIARPQGSADDCGAYEYFSYDLPSDIEDGRIQFNGGDADNSGYLDSSEWTSMGLALASFTAIDDGDGELTMAELLVAAGLTLDSLSEVYVSFGSDPTGIGVSHSPVSSLTEGLALVKKDDIGIIWILPGSSSEVFKSSTEIDPGATITLKRVDAPSNSPVTIGAGE